MNYKLKELTVTVNADNVARNVRAISTGATLQVYDSNIDAFRTLPSGDYRSFSLADKVIRIGDANWQAMQNGSPLYIYARVSSTYITEDNVEEEIIPDHADILFTLHTPQEYTPEGMDQMAGDDRYGHVYYINLGYMTYNSETEKCEVQFSTGTLGSDQYREEGSAAEMFEQVELQGEKMVKQRRAVLAIRQNVTTRPFSTVGEEEVMLDPEENPYNVILLSLCNGSPTLYLPIARDYVGQEYTFVGVAPSYGMTQASKEYPALISVSSRQDVITYIRQNKPYDIRDFNPAYPCIIKMLATHIGWVVVNGTEYMPGNQPDPSGDDEEGGDGDGYYDPYYNGEYTAENNPFMGEL